MNPALHSVLLALPDEGGEPAGIPVFRMASIAGVVGIILTCMGLWLAFHTFKNARNDQPKKNVDMTKNVLMGFFVAVLCAGTGVIAVIASLIGYFTTWTPDTTILGG